MMEDAPIFATELRYHRTLSERGVRIFILTLAGITAAASALLLSFGLWPLVPFMAGDVVFLAIAMKICVADRAASEQISVDRDGVRIATFDRRRRKVRDEHLPLYGLTLERVTDPNFGLKSVYLSLRGRGVEIARGLAPQQRAQFAETFEASLKDAGLQLWRRDRVLPSMTPTH